jgi:hypothetical protein
VNQQQPLSGATIVAIAALWFHVALAAVLLFVVPRGVAGAAALMYGVVWMFAYASIAMGLQRRQGWARPAGIAVSALSYLIGLGSGRVISTVLLILIPLLIPQPAPPLPRPPDRPPYSGIPRRPWD